MSFMDAKEYQYLYGTIFVFGLITFGMYRCLLRPPLAQSRQQQQQPAGGSSRLQHQAGGAASSGHAAGSTGSSSGSRFFPRHVASSSSSARLPPHVVPTAPPTALSSSLAADGLVSFRQTLAFRHSDDVTARERARILSKLLMGSSSSSSSATTAAPDVASAAPAPTLLPPRGGIWILSLEVTQSNVADDAMWDRIYPVLCALGTYYNLLVILALPSIEMDGGITSSNGGSDDAAAAAATAAVAAAKQLRAEWIAKLRSPSQSSERAAAGGPFSGWGVPIEVLPSHRIVASTTVAGRVAFVRQVQRVGIVLDFDPDVRDQLSRFGHKVVVYDPRANL